MKIVAFTDDQMVTLLEYLESQFESGYTLEDVIEGIKDGTITRSAVADADKIAG
jgi:hypothetical protein